jgi:peptidyl-prolyl cis-trans isomerase SurA
MRLSFLLLAILFTLTASVSRTIAQQAEIIDGVAAIVNNDVITISQVRELVGARERALREGYQGPDLADRIKEMRLAALKDLVDRQLIIQEFQKMQEKGANIPDHVIDDRIQGIIRQEFGGDRAAFIRTLQAQGYTLTRFKEIEKEKIIVQAMRQAKLNDNFVVSPNQVQGFYDKNKADFTIPDQVKLRMIILREGNEGNSADSGNKAQTADEIRQKLIEGADFNRMAQMYSEDESTRDMGGDWGWVERNTLNEELTKAAFSLKAGGISPVIQLGDSYYILNVEARKNASVKPMSEVREAIEQNLMQQERMKAQQRWLDSLRKRAYIKILT